MTSDRRVYTVLVIAVSKREGVVTDSYGTITQCLRPRRGLPSSEQSRLYPAFDHSYVGQWPIVSIAWERGRARERERDREEETNASEEPCVMSVVYTVWVFHVCICVW